MTSPSYQVLKAFIFKRLAGLGDLRINWKPRLGILMLDLLTAFCDQGPTDLTSINILIIFFQKKRGRGWVLFVILVM